uniref:SKP1 component POZ domain-containing protein n=1 Tax=Anopheles stephensi TaxID=30069 RepID=A0A182Y3X1_ANOST
MDTIQLKSRDGKIVIAKRIILARSTVLQKKLDELNDSTEKGDTLEVSEADGESLGKIIQWMNRMEGSSQEETEPDGASEPMIPNNQEQEMERVANNNTTEGCDGAFDKEWFTSFPQFCVLVAVANRLRLADFVDAAVRFVVEWRVGKNLEDIREMMDNLGSNVRGPIQADGEADTER